MYIVAIKFVIYLCKIYRILLGKHLQVKASIYAVVILAFIGVACPGEYATNHVRYL